jgi:hypothetical protein
VDRFENQFRYGGNICDGRTIDQYTYTVGNVQKVKQAIEENSLGQITGAAQIVGGLLTGGFGLPLTIRALGGSGIAYDLLWYELEPGTQNTWFRHSCRPVDWAEYDSGHEVRWPDEYIYSAPLGQDGEVFPAWIEYIRQLLNNQNPTPPDYELISEELDSARIPLSQAANFTEYIGVRQTLINQLTSICAAGTGETLLERCDDVIQVSGNDQSAFNEARAAYQRLSGSFIASNQRRLILDSLRAGISEDGSEGSLIELGELYQTVGCGSLPPLDIGFDSPNPNNNPTLPAPTPPPTDDPEEPDDPEEGPETQDPATNPLYYDPRDEIRNQQ